MIELVFIVYAAANIDFSFGVASVFRNLKDAEKYCIDQGFHLVKNKDTDEYYENNKGDRFIISPSEVR